MAIDLNELNSDDRYRTVAMNQFNSITAENIFKPVYLHPNENTFNWVEADQLVDFCETNNKRLHGHTLIWHNQLPSWIENFEGTSSDWDLMFKKHIQTICTHFKGKVSSWDVVNEAFEDNGELRNTIWRQKIGDSYIEKAFVYAHESDPDAVLFYNDYNIASKKAKRQAILELFNSLRQKGVPIHGIGMQMHISIDYPKNKKIENALTELSDDGYKIHFSEIDISVNPNGKDIEPSTELYDCQADKLTAITKLYKEIPSEYQYGMTFWGVSDQNTWIRTFFGREDYPLLFDDDYNTKPVYCKFKETL
ncbi:MAG: endo-1,4-beta-xylanase [Aureispira sp.]|nr:endo-1,4-beta-xylanase [Aureispira sp.]